MSQNIQSHKLGHWLPKDYHWTRKWLSNLIDHAAKNDKPLKHELRQFQELVDGDVNLKVLAFLMFTEVPHKEPYCHDPLGKPQVRNFDHILRLINHIMDSGPRWSTIADKIGLISFPINAILD